MEVTEVYQVPLGTKARKEAAVVVVGTERKAERKETPKQEKIGSTDLERRNLKEGAVCRTA
jgi:hypothetical protein